METSRTGNLGGQVTLGIMPGGSAFTMGARLRGGTYLGENSTLGNIGAAMMFGANFARNVKGDEFSYALGGLATTGIRIGCVVGSKTTGPGAAPRTR